MTALLGVLPVLATPFGPNWQIDAAALQREIDWLFDNGADGLTVAMVSEIQRLSHAERAELNALTCEFSAGRGPVVASVGAESTYVACQLARSAAQAGASAVMAAPPLLAATPELELRRYLEAIAQAAQCPVILQDASNYVGVPVPVPVQAALVRDFGPDQLLLKPEAAPLGPTLGAIAQATGGTARMFDGSGGIGLIESHARGVVGTMPGPDLVWALRALWDALQAGDAALARSIQGPLAGIQAMTVGIDGYVTVEKHLLVRQHVLPHARMRPPVTFPFDEVSAGCVEDLVAELAARVGRPPLDPVPADS